MPDWLEPISDGSNLQEFNSQKIQLTVIKRDPFTRKWHRAKLPVTPAQFDDWCCGASIQSAMPHLNADQREFILTGITPDSWNLAFRRE